MTDYESPRPRRGIIAAPSPPAPVDWLALLEDVRQRETVPLVELARRVGWDIQAQRRAVREGLVTPHPASTPRRRRVDQDEAASVLLAALLAAAAGIAVTVMLRGVKGAGIGGAAAAALVYAAANRPEGAAALLPAIPA